MFSSLFSSRSSCGIVLSLALILPLFGCGKVGGPEDIQQEEFTFTAEDVTRFRELAEEASRTTAVGTGARLGVPYLEPVAPEEDDGVRLSLHEAHELLRAPTEAGENAYRVTNAFLNVRAEPRVTAPVVVRLTRGDALQVLDFIDATWAQVRLSGGREGYVAQRYMGKIVTEAKLAEEKKAFEKLFFVDFAFVNVRRAPDPQSEKLGELPGQSFVRPISMDGAWARVPFAGKEGYVARQYLSLFSPNFLVRQDAYTLPVLHYVLAEDMDFDQLVTHVGALRREGVHVLPFQEFYTTLLRQEKQDVRLPPRSVLLALSGITSRNVREVSERMASLGVRATLFLPTSQLGLAGITEKMVLTLLANGFDLQSAGHMGEDLRALTNAQLDLELTQSRRLLAEFTKKPVFAVLYPQGGVNDRVAQRAAEAGYLFGVGSVPERSFSRTQFLRLPSYLVGKGMTAEDVVRIAKGG